MQNSGHAPTLSTNEAEDACQYLGKAVLHRPVMVSHFLRGCLLSAQCRAIILERESGFGPDKAQ